MDVIRDLAYPLPVTVIARIIGLPEEDRAQFKKWSDDIVGFLGSGDAQVLALHPCIGRLPGFFVRGNNVVPHTHRQKDVGRPCSLSSATMSGLSCMHWRCKAVVKNPCPAFPLRELSFYAPARTPSEPTPSAISARPGTRSTGRNEVLVLFQRRRHWVPWDSARFQLWLDRP